jgi:hypothetical protein
MPAEQGDKVCTQLLTGVCLGMFFSAGAAANTNQDWFTLYGDSTSPRGDLVEVLPEPTPLGDRVLLDLRVSRKDQRTSFRGGKYFSYYAKVAVNCKEQTAWYLWLNYYSQPRWLGPITSRESYAEGEAPVLFKDIPTHPYIKLIKAACVVSRS